MGAPAGGLIPCFQDMPGGPGPCLPARYAVEEDGRLLYSCGVCVGHAVLRVMGGYGFDGGNLATCRVSEVWQPPDAYADVVRRVLDPTAATGG